MGSAPPPVPYAGPYTQDDLELFGRYRFLYPIQVLGEGYEVPEGTSALRALQFIEMKRRAVRLPYWNYCWNDTVGCCEMSYRSEPGGAVQVGRACTLRVRPGLEIVKLPKGGKKCG